MLANDVAIIFVVVYAVEAALIIVGNAFTIFVFSTLTRTSHIKRTCYLLINLAVADLFVGITEPIVLGTSKFHEMTATTLSTLLSGQSYCMSNQTEIEFFIVDNIIEELYTQKP